MEAYFDNAATTKPLKLVLDKMLEVYEEYGNPSSLHMKGIKAEGYIKEAKDIFSKILKVAPKEIYFTSGGTESNNLALIGTALANKRSGNHIITSAIEHASVSSTVKALEEFGFKISLLPVNESGIVNQQDLERLLTEETILVSIMHVNNEIGSVQPIDAIGKKIKAINAKTLFHVDAIQSFGKFELNPKQSNIDLLSISGHKFHGPKGVGALYVRDKVKIKPILFGGAHQKGLRSGTENVPGIAGMAAAAEEMYHNHKEKVQYLYQLKRELVEGIMANIEDVVINGMSLEESAPHIVNIRFRKIRGEVLLHSLEEKGIFVSTGSACASHKSALSKTLEALGLDQTALDESIRFSLSVYNTKEEVDFLIKVLKKEVPFLRRYVRGGK